MRNLKKLFSLTLGLLLCVQAVLVGGIAIHATGETNNGQVSYTDSFDYDVYDRIWQQEVATSSNKNANFSAPDVQNGVIKLTEGESARLNWTKIPNIVVSAAKTYTISFKVKITDLGNDQPYLSSQTTWKRELYVALGGYHDQVKFENSKDNGASALYAGDGTWGTDGYAVGNEYTVTVVWNNSTGRVDTTIENGEYSLSGYRKKDAYIGMEALCSFWAFRCEDGACEIRDFSFSDGTNTYAPTDISFAETDNMAASGLWGIESKEKKDATIPVLSNGAVKLTSYNSIKFDWTGVEGVGTYDPTNIYTFAFDFTVTDDGDGSEWGAGSGCSRALYVAPGGWYNQLEIPDKNSRVRAGETYIAYDAATMENTRYRAQIVWEGSVISTTVTDAQGNVLVSGSRTNTAYADIEARSGAMTYLVFRCEDGTVEIDNFAFTMQKNTKISTTEFSIPEGKQAIYSCTLTYAGRQ